MLTDGLLSREQRNQIIVHTVDGAQGFAADFAIVDFVQTSFPGCTSDRRRICVSITRARQAEMILMNRGMFVGYRERLEEMKYGSDYRLLCKIYSEVASNNGIVTMNVAEPKIDEAPTVEPDEAKGGDRCFNCGQLGHRKKECLSPLKCSNCAQPSHISTICVLPKVQRCRNCGRQEHSQAVCRVRDEAG